MDFKTIIEPFKIKTVEPIHLSTEQQREEFLKDAFFNTFLLQSDQVIIDFLTDSGTSAMSSAQWAGMMNGDEAYAGSKSWSRMESVIQDLTAVTTYSQRIRAGLQKGYFIVIWVVMAKSLSVIPILIQRGQT